MLNSPIKFITVQEFLDLKRPEDLNERWREPVTVLVRISGLTQIARVRAAADKAGLIAEWHDRYKAWTITPRL